MRAMRLGCLFLGASLYAVGCESATPVGMPTDESPDLSDGNIVVEDAGVQMDSAALCPDDMVRFVDFCMDRYEAPNQAGVPPLAMRNALEGVAFCEARGKRLCTEAEWVRACQGPAGLPYPYGPAYQRSRCNDDKIWRSPSWTVLGTWPSAEAQAEAMRLYQADPSGSRGGCASAEGVQDLTGNVAEWVVRSFPNSTNYDHVMKGCYWAGCYGGTSPSCAFVNPAHPGAFRSYEAGFRCCLSPSRS
jgi:sulfatase modifying factor 1